MLDPRNDKLQVFDSIVHAIDLIEDRIGLRCRAVAATPPIEELNADRSLGVLHHATDARRGDVQQPRRTGDRAGYHDGADDLDLTQCEHLQRSRKSEVPPLQPSSPQFFLASSQWRRRPRTFQWQVSDGNDGEAPGKMLPEPCQGWGRGFESLRPLQNP